MDYQCATPSPTKFALWNVIDDKFISTVELEGEGIFETMVFHISDIEKLTMKTSDTAVSLNPEAIDFGIEYPAYFKRSPSKEEITAWHEQTIAAIRKEKENHDND